MGFAVRQGDSAVAAARRRARAWMLILLGLVLMIGLILAPLAFVLYELMGLVVAHMSY
ncbi:hypothetical protein ACIP5Y_47800 [Nocardia sp. NPDC088792]|uniref:hypothetical protein n=1 Tax=Nocardia sp. NPDC088792 TaxID=3364332 RepID=UPI0038154AA7